MVGAIKGCTGVDPTIVGKPSPLMIDYIIQKYGVERCVTGAQSSPPCFCIFGVLCCGGHLEYLCVASSLAER